MNPLSSALARASETENASKASNANKAVASSTRAKPNSGSRTNKLAPTIVATVKFDSANSKPGNEESQTNLDANGDAIAKIKRSENSDTSNLAFEVQAPEGPADSDSVQLNLRESWNGPPRLIVNNYSQHPRLDFEAKRRGVRQLSIPTRFSVKKHFRIARQKACPAPGNRRPRRQFS